MSFLFGLAGALGAGVAWALIDGGPYEVITGAMVGFVGALLGWRYYVKPRLRHLDRFKTGQ
jgi:hypothetical protein